MAKLEDLVTPSEILDVMKDGAVKSDLIKRFKTSDAELAKMLLLLYRGGQLTKEQFNKFFQGLPITEEELPREVSDTIPFVKIEEPTPPSPEPPPLPAAEAPEPAPPHPISATPPPAPPSTAETSPAEKEELPRPAAEAAAVEPVHVEEVEEVEEVQEVEEPVQIVSEVSPTPVTVEDEGALASPVLEMILARLSSIDKRLSGIEKKLGLT